MSQPMRDLMDRASRSTRFATICRLSCSGVVLANRCVLNTCSASKHATTFPRPISSNAMIGKRLGRYSGSRTCNASAVLTACSGSPRRINFCVAEDKSHLSAGNPRRVNRTLRSSPGIGAAKRSFALATRNFGLVPKASDTYCGCVVTETC